MSTQNIFNSIDYAKINDNQYLKTKMNFIKANLAYIKNMDDAMQLVMDLQFYRNLNTSVDILRALIDKLWPTKDQPSYQYTHQQAQQYMKMAITKLLTEQFNALPNNIKLEPIKLTYTNNSRMNQQIWVDQQRVHWKSNINSDNNIENNADVLHSIGLTRDDNDQREFLSDPTADVISYLTSLKSRYQMSNPIANWFLRISALQKWEHQIRHVLINYYLNHRVIKDHHPQMDYYMTNNIITNVQYTKLTTK